MNLRRLNFFALLCENPGIPEPLFLIPIYWKRKDELGMETIVQKF
jgi:hypothetical protein